LQDENVGMSRKERFECRLEFMGYSQDNSLELIIFTNKPGRVVTFSLLVQRRGMHAVAMCKIYHSSLILSNNITQKYSPS
jgi:hypothetical protein